MSSVAVLSLADADYSALLEFELRRVEFSEVRTIGVGPNAVIEMSGTSDVDILFLDMGPATSGLGIFSQLHETHPAVPVVAVVDPSDTAIGREAVRLGAEDFVTRGQDDAMKVRSVAARIFKQASLQGEVERLRKGAGKPQAMESITGESAAMAEVFRMVGKALLGDLTVAVLGESGTGKELVANAIHAGSDRASGPFVTVNCAAIPRDLMESEFFWHERGSFTGAHARHIGKLEQADGGSLFLDEIGELDLDLQAKLLRAIQSREIIRVGGHEVIPFDARIICATHRDIAGMVAQRTFREDLYYRLFQFPLQIPPLRDRDQDVLLLAEQFREELLGKYDKIPRRTFATEAKHAMLQHSWPGNVRELRNAVERALLVSEGAEIGAADLILESAPSIPAVQPVSGGVSNLAQMPVRSRDGRGSSIGSAVAQRPSANSSWNPEQPHTDAILSMREVKRRAVEHAVRACEGNIEQAARRLQVSRSTVYRILEDRALTA